MNHFALDFLTGFGLMNAMPHFIFGIAKIRFFSAFGFSARGNLAYAALNLAVALAAFYANHGLPDLAEHGIFLGCLFILASYLVTGKMFYRIFHERVVGSRSVEHGLQPSHGR